jgi:hypothetical protein
MRRSGLRLDETMKSRLAARFLVVASALGASGAAAQCTPGGPPNPAAVRRAIVGIVMDSSHVPIEGADVVIKDPRRAVKTRADGGFQIDSLAPGTYELTARRIGHEIAVQSYTVTDSGGIARFCLIPEPHTLAPMITASRRAGLSGFVGDTAYQMLAGAEIRVVAGGAHATTDSAGGFYLPLKPGSYPITVKKEGYGTQLLSVTVPEDSGRQIAVWLGAPPRNARRIAAAIEDSMRYRMLMVARASTFKLLSSEDVMRTPADLMRTVQGAVVAPVAMECEAIIDGGPYSLPLYVIDKSEIAAMEVYALKPSRGGATSIDSRGTASAGAAGTCKVKVYVWLKP